MSPGVSSETALLADIGGTNLRFALLQNGELGSITRFKVSDFPGPEEAIEAFFSQAAPETRPRRAALAVAGPVTDESARLSNGTWHFSSRDLRVAFDLDRLALVNDFVAVALALPHLMAQDLEKLGGSRALPGAPMAVIGPGTGLGVAALLSSGDGRLALASEGGHATLAAQDERESALLEALRTEIGHVAAEDIISGPGLGNIYRGIAELEGIPAPPRRPAEITRAALAGDCSASVAALELFCALLGSFAGDLVLIFGARGGLYLAGGILPPLGGILRRSRFRDHFEAKGAFKEYLTEVPTYLITKPDPAFLGLESLLADL